MVKRTKEQKVDKSTAEFEGNLAANARPKLVTN